jgi:hypothetical protein
MTATITFNLDDIDDAMAHTRAIKSLDMALALWKLSGKIRELIDTSEDGKYIDEKYLTEAWDNVMQEFDINFYKLIS